MRSGLHAVIWTCSGGEGTRGHRRYRPARCGTLPHRPSSCWPCKRGTHSAELAGPGGAQQHGAVPPCPELVCQRCQHHWHSQCDCASRTCLPVLVLYTFRSYNCVVHLPRLQLCCTIYCGHPVEVAVRVGGVVFAFLLCWPGWGTGEGSVSRNVRLWLPGCRGPRTCRIHGRWPVCQRRCRPC